MTCFPDRSTMNVLLTALLLGVVLAIAYLARAVIIIFAFSILFAYLINPVVSSLQRHSLFFKNLRGPHVAEAYLAMLILIGLLVHSLAPQFVPRVSRFLSESPALMEDLYSGNLAITLGQQNGWDQASSQRVKLFLEQRQATIRGLVESIREFASIALSGIVLIPVLGLFFLSDGEKLANGIIHLVSTRENMEDVRSLALDLDNMLRHYIRAKVILAALSFAYCTAAMFFLGYPHALALGLTAGVLEFIPVAGWITAAFTISVVGLMTHSHWIWMALLLCVWRVLMDYAISPRVVGRELEIHPLLAIFTVMVGGAVGGIVGIYLSVPLVAALRVVWRRFANPAQAIASTSS